MYHGAFDRLVSYIKLSNASRYSSYFLFCFRSCLDTLQFVVSSAKSVSSLFFCSCLSIWKKNFMTRYPLSARVLSNLLVLSTLFRYSLSDSSPDILPPTMSLIQPPSRNANSPCSGIRISRIPAFPTARMIATMRRYAGSENRQSLILNRKHIGISASR